IMRSPRAADGTLRFRSGRSPPHIPALRISASFARERHEALEGTGFAPKAREASAERAAREELPELALDKAGQTATVGAVGDLAQERFQVVADEAVEDGALCGPGLVGGGAHGRRASEARAVAGSTARRMMAGRVAGGVATPRCNTAL